MPERSEPIEIQIAEYLNYRYSGMWIPEPIKPQASGYLTLVAQIYGYLKLLNPKYLHK